MTLAPVSGGSSVGSGRIDSIDALRGVVMLLMALDHVRDFFGQTPFPPEDISRTTPGLFFTRWITHFCAPVFVFLAGTGAFLYGARGRSRGEVSRFLLSRGLWLIAIEILVVNPSWFLELWLEGIPLFFVQVIWVIGVSMIVLAALIHLPLGAVAAIGIAMIAGHNTLDGAAVPQDPATTTAIDKIWIFLHGGSWGIPLGRGFHLAVRYPLLPWIGVMAAGYAFGGLFRLERARRDRACVALGLGAIAAFLALRGTNLYGDPNPWTPQGRGPAYTLLSFLNCEKYPPSLSFLLMTLGPAIAALPFLERALGPLHRVAVLIGRVPLFYYVVHLPLIHAAAAAYAVAVGRSPGWWNMIQGPPAGYAPSLSLVYFVWIVALLVLYPLCRWFADVKRRRSDWWLRYL